MILVSGGASGFLGPHVVAQLRKRNHAVVAPPHSMYDLTLSGAAEAMLDTCHPETVIHLAARVGGIGANRENPATFFYDNLVMGVQLMHAAYKAGVRKFVQVGTVCGYPKDAAVPFKETEFWDGYPEPTNAPYGIAKKTLLVMAQAYRQQYGWNAIYLIPTNLYGPGDHFDPESGHVIPAMILKMLNAVEQGDSEVTLWGDGTPTREFIYVEDAAKGIVMATERYNKPMPINLGSGCEVTIHGLAQMVADETGFRGNIVWDKDKPNGQMRRKVSTTRAEKEFGFKAKTPLANGIAKTVAWYKANREAKKW